MNNDVSYPEFRDLSCSKDTKYKQATQVHTEEKPDTCNRRFRMLPMK